MKICIVMGGEIKHPYCGLFNYANNLFTALACQHSCSILAPHSTLKRQHILVEMLRPLIKMKVTKNHPVKLSLKPASEGQARPYFLEKRGKNFYDTYLLEYAYKYVKKFNRSHSLITITKPDYDILWANSPQELVLHMQSRFKICTFHDIFPVSHWPIHFKQHFKTPSKMQKYAAEFDMLCKKLLADMDIICCVSEYTKSMILKHYPKVDPAKLMVTYHSINPKDYQLDGIDFKMILNQYTLKENGFFICIGWVTTAKNQISSIKAYLSVKTDFPLVIVGRLALNNEKDVFLFNTLIQENQTRIIYLGEVSQTHLTVLLKYAKALLFPSLSEGFGTPILEAFYLGTPVLTSNISATKEVAGDAAVLVSPTDIDSIAQGIKRLIEEKELVRALVAKGKKRYQYFSPEAYARRINNVISLLNKKESNALKHDQELSVNLT